MKLLSRGSLSLLLLIGVAACGSGSGPNPIANIVPVSGRVTLDGAPLEQGTITFAPDDPAGQPATGQIEDGHFTMRTTVSAPGVVIGKYKVRVISTLPLAGPGLAPNVPPDPNVPPPEPESLIPKKYNDIKTSGLTADITGETDALVFELKSE